MQDHPRLLALASGSEARLIPGPNRKPRGTRIAATYRMEDQYRPGRPQLTETYIIGGEADLVFPDFGWEQRLHPAIEYAEKVHETIRSMPNPKVPSGWPLRWEFVCKARPEVARFQYTNKQMLYLFARAVMLGQDTIRPDRIW